MHNFSLLFAISFCHPCIASGLLSFSMVPVSHPETFLCLSRWGLLCVSSWFVFSGSFELHFFTDGIQTLTVFLFTLISFTTLLPSCGAHYQVPVDNKSRPCVFILFFFNPQILFPISTVDLCLRYFLDDIPCSKRWCSRYDEIRLAVSPFCVLSCTWESPNTYQQDTPYRDGIHLGSRKNRYL